MVIAAPRSSPSPAGGAQHGHGETEAPGTTQRRSHIPITHQLGSGGDTQASPEDQAGSSAQGAGRGLLKGTGARVATAAAQAGADATVPAEPWHEQSPERG